MIAKQLGKSRRQVVGQAMARWVAREEERYRLTLEGLADVEAGRLVDHAAVEFWAKGLGR